MKRLFYLLGLGLPLLAAAQTPPASPDYPRNATVEKKAKVERAVDRCKAQRGVDCDTPAGLNEWLLQERSRNEAVKDGSRSRVGGASN